MDSLLSTYLNLKNFKFALLEQILCGSEGTSFGVGGEQFGIEKWSHI